VLHKTKCLEKTK